jgi:hypothetical protein
LEKIIVIADSWKPAMTLILMAENQPISGLEINLYGKGPPKNKPL